MKPLKIGFVDYYLDEFHANHFPDWIRNSKYADRFSLEYAYAIKDKEGGLTTAQWCEKQKIAQAETMQQLVDSSDCIVVLAPDEAHSHEQLGELALKAGKPVFFDKVLADDTESAKRICDMAKQNSARMYSSSALRFFNELSELPKDKTTDDIAVITISGAASFDVYIVHQIEMLVRLYGTAINRIMNVGTVEHPVLVAELDNATATLTVMGKLPFSFSIGYQDNTTCHVQDCTNFFPLSIDAMLEFFLGEDAPSTDEQAICVVATHEAAHIARNNPFEWAKVEK